MIKSYLYLKSHRAKVTPVINKFKKKKKLLLTINLS